LGFQRWLKISLTHSECTVLGVRTIFANSRANPYREVAYSILFHYRDKKFTFFLISRFVSFADHILFLFSLNTGKYRVILPVPNIWGKMFFQGNFASMHGLKFLKKKIGFQTSFNSFPLKLLNYF